MFRVSKSSLGYVRLSDDCEFAFRVVIVGLREVWLRANWAFIHITTTVHAYISLCPDRLRELVKDKPVGLPNDAVKRLDVW